VNAVTEHGLALPHAVNVGEVMEDKSLGREDAGYSTRFSFTVWTTAGSHIDYVGGDKKDMDAKRAKLIADINEYWSLANGRPSASGPEGGPK